MLSIHSSSRDVLFDENTVSLQEEESFTGQCFINSLTQLCLECTTLSIRLLASNADLLVFKTQALHLLPETL